MNTSRKLLLSASLLLVAAVNAQLPVMSVQPGMLSSIGSLTAEGCSNFGHSFVASEASKHVVMPAAYAVKNAAVATYNGICKASVACGKYFYNKGVAGSLGEISADALLLGAAAVTGYYAYQGGKALYNRFANQDAKTEVKKDEVKQSTEVKKDEVKQPVANTPVIKKNNKHGKNHGHNVVRRNKHVNKRGSKKVAGHNGVAKRRQAKHVKSK